MKWRAHKGKIQDLNRDFDYTFWQSQTPLARLEAAWQMVREYHVDILGEDENKLRLQRSLVVVKQVQR